MQETASIALAERLQAEEAERHRITSRRSRYLCKYIIFHIIILTQSQILKWLGKFENIGFWTGKWSFLLALLCPDASCPLPSRLLRLEVSNLLSPEASQGTSPLRPKALNFGITPDPFAFPLSQMIWRKLFLSILRYMTLQWHCH